MEGEKFDLHWTVVFWLWVGIGCVVPNAILAYIIYRIFW